MTPEELAEVEERCRKATAGPWEAERAVDLAGFEQNDLWIIMRGQPCAYRFDRTEDAEFCAHARADVPALVAEVRRLREENARLNRTSLPHMCRDGHEEIRHAGSSELCPVCEAHENLKRLADYALCGTGGVEDVGHSPESHLPPTGLVPRTAYDAIGKWRAEVGNLRAEVARLREALDAAQRIVKRKADREAGREEGDHVG